jgi:hypothetical protein
LKPQKDVVQLQYKSVHPKVQAGPGKWSSTVVRFSSVCISPMIGIYSSVIQGCFTRPNSGRSTGGHSFHSPSGWFLLRIAYFRSRHAARGVVTVRRRPNLSSITDRCRYFLCSSQCPCRLWAHPSRARVSFRRDKSTEARHNSSSAPAV